MLLHHLQLAQYSIRISPGCDTRGDRVAAMDAEEANLSAVKETKMNLRKWVNKRVPQVGEVDQLKLKVVVLHDGISKEVHMNQPYVFVVAKSVDG